MASKDHGIHSFEECVLEGSDYFQQNLRRAHIRRSSTKEDGSNWRSSSHHPKKIPQVMRNMKNSTLEEPLIHLRIWIRNNAIMNEEDDEAEVSRRSLPMKQIKISIQLSFMILFSYTFVYIQLMFEYFAFILLNCT